MRKFNLDQFLWFIILFFITSILCFMTISKKLFLLIDGQRVFSTALMIITLIILTAIQFNKIFTIPSREGIRGGYIQYFFMIFILGVVCIIDIPKTALEMKGVKLYHDASEHSDKHSHKHDIVNKKGKIIINSENFHDYVEEITAHIDEYVGREIEVEGTYYESENIDDMFIVTQLNMNCCIADSEYLGVLCDKTENKFKFGDKVVINGVISKVNHEGKDLIKIKDLIN